MYAHVRSCSCSTRFAIENGRSSPFPFYASDPFRVLSRCIRQLFRSFSYSPCALHLFSTRRLPLSLSRTTRSFVLRENRFPFHHALACESLSSFYDCCASFSPRELARFKLFMPILNSSRATLLFALRFCRPDKISIFRKYRYKSKENHC